MVYNHTIAFLKQRPSKDDIGQNKPVWEATGLTALAKVSPVSGKLFYDAARAREENTVLFRFNYSFLPADFNKIDYRVLYNGNQYEIKQIADVGERHLEVQLRGVSV